MSVLSKVNSSKTPLGGLLVSTPGFSLQVLSGLRFHDIVRCGAVCKAWRPLRDRAIQTNLSLVDVDNDLVKDVQHYLYTTTKVAFYQQCGLPASMMMRNDRGIEDLTRRDCKLPEYFTFNYISEVCGKPVSVYCGTARKKEEEDLNIATWIEVPNVKAPTPKQITARNRWIYERVRSVSVTYNLDDGIWLDGFINYYCLGNVSNTITSVTLRNLKGPDGYKREHRDFPVIADMDYAPFLTNVVKLQKCPNLTRLTLETESAPLERTLKAIASCTQLRSLSLVYKYSNWLSQCLPQMPQQVPGDALLSLLGALPQLETINVVRKQKDETADEYSPDPANDGAKAALSLQKDVAALQKGIAAKQAELEGFKLQLEANKAKQAAAANAVQPLQ